MGLGSDINENKTVVPPVDNSDCGICLEPLASKDEDRTPVKLRCSHQYHLACIGSAFNAKNKMQCPTCRQVEKGEWLYAQPQPQPNPPVPDFNIDDWLPEPEQLPLDLSLDMPNMGLHGPQLRRENVLPYAHSYLDRIFPNSDRSASFAPDEIPDVFLMYDASGRVSPSETMRLQHQLRDHLAWHANQRRLTDMSHMMYGYGGSSGGINNGGASSSGGNVGDWEEAVFANGGGTDTGECVCGGFCYRYEWF